MNEYPQITATTTATTAIGGYTNNLYGSWITDNLTVDSNHINVTPYINNLDAFINGSTQNVIKSYDEAMNFKKTNESTVYIKQDVLLQLIERIKELEESNSKNWAELLGGEKDE